MATSESIQMESEEHKHPRNKKRLLAWTLVLLICALLLLPLFHQTKVPAAGGPGGPSAGGAAEVNVATAATGSMDIYLDALGTVTPQNTVNLYSLVNGRVLSVGYREGQMVSKGQLLAEIDPAPYQAQLQQALGTLKRDSALLEQARSDLKRYQTAIKDHAVSEQTLYNQEQTVKQYEGTVENDQGTVQYDKVQLGYCRIVAPMSGRIGLRLIDPGNTIFSGSSNTIAVITQIDPITVVFSVPEDRLPQVRKRFAKTSALSVDVYDRAQTAQLAAGKLLTFDNAVDTSTGTVKLRALFNNRDNSLFPNQFVNTRLQIDTLTDAILIPTVAIQYNGQQAFVYRVKADKTIAIQNIAVINTDKGKSAITGLTAGDTVVISNFDRVQEGAAVTIAGESRPQPAAGKPAAK